MILIVVCSFAPFVVLGCGYLAAWQVPKDGCRFVSGGDMPLWLQAISPLILIIGVAAVVGWAVIK